MADQSGTSDEKYIVFKRKDWEQFCADAFVDGGAEIATEMALEDAVVIRRRDVFAPPALDAYANSITVALSLIDEDSSEFTQRRRHRLQNIADYFAAQAALAWDTNRKHPD